MVNYLENINSDIIQRNLNKHIHVSQRETFGSELKQVFNPDDVFYTTKEAVRYLKQTLGKWSKNYPKLKSVAERNDLYNLFSYLNFGYRIIRMIYTTNWIERLNKSLKNAECFAQSKISNCPDGICCHGDGTKTI